MRIALTGRMRSGKDTVACYLIDNYGYQRFALSTGIHQTIELLFPEIAAQGEKPRALLQGLAQDLRRYDSNVWINYLLRELGEQTQLESNIIVSDLRQPNEFDALKRAGFKIVRVNSDEAIRLCRMTALGDKFTRADMNHYTEMHIETFECDFDIYNNGNIAELQQQIELMLFYFQEVNKASGQR